MPPLPTQKHAIHCPHCQSTNTARIIWGYMEMPDEKMQKQIDAGKLYIGGCSPEIVEHIDNDIWEMSAATRHCNTCNKNY